MLVNQVFPELRRRARERFVDVVEVDLRWGITQEEAERGEVLPICLREIERSRPYFIGLLGERYGWVPSEGQYPTRVLEEHSWLGEHVGGKSLTELEILHGVLNAPEMAGRAFFYFRDAAYAQAYGAEFISASLEDAAKLVNLKERIQRSGFPLVRNYQSPRELADQVCEDLWKLIDTQFPEDEVPDQFERERRMHAAYAKQRIGLHIGGEVLVDSIAHRLAQAKSGAGDALTRVTVITGQSGGGKSTLMANWLARHRTTHPNDLVFDHYLGCTADSGHPELLVRRLIQWIQRVTKSIEQPPDAIIRKDEIPAEKEKLYEALPQWLGTLSEYARQQGAQAIIAIDALDKLSHDKHIPWLPMYVPPYVHVVVSTLDGEAMKACNERGWFALAVPALEQQQREEFISQYLGRFTRKLSANEIKAILAQPLSALPLYLKVLLDELRYASSHETLVESLQTYLSCTSIEDLYGQVLERVENQCGKAAVQNAMTSLWASRSGLSQTELLAMHALPPAGWSTIRLQLDDAIYDEGGLMRFTHDYMRAAVGGRYLSRRMHQRKAHLVAGKWWRTQIVTSRVLVELPWQLYSAHAWEDLRNCLTDFDTATAAVLYIDNIQLFKYWMGIESNSSLRMEGELEKVFLEWIQHSESLAAEEVARCVSELLDTAGRWGSLNEKLLLRSLIIREKRLGKNHISIATNLQNLAAFYKQIGDMSNAKILYERTLSIRMRKKGSKNLDIASSMCDLAVLKESLGDYKESEILHKRALAMREKIAGRNHPDVAVSLNNLASLYISLSRFSNALPLLERSLRIRKQAFGDTDSLVAGTLDQIGVVYQNIHDYVNAKKYHLNALKIWEKVFDKNHPIISTCISNIATLYRAKGDLKRSKDYYERALAIDEKYLGLNHPDLAISLNNLGNLCTDCGEYENAEAYHKKSMKINLKVYGKEHDSVALNLGNLGCVYLGQYQIAKAAASLNQSLGIYERVLGKSHIKVAMCLNNLALCLEEQGQIGRATSMRQRARRIQISYEKKYGKNQFSN